MLCLWLAKWDNCEKSGHKRESRQEMPRNAKKCQEFGYDLSQAGSAPLIGRQVNCRQYPLSPMSKALLRKTL